MKQNNKYKILLPILIILLTFTSTNQWSKIPIGNTTFKWVICLFTLIMFLYEKQRRNIFFTKNGYWIVALYLLWAVIGIIRGVFVMENYWESKALVSNSFILLLPVCVYAFYSPFVVDKTLRMWMKIAFPACFIFFIWVVGITQFYLGPLFLILCLFPIINKKWWVYSILFVGLYFLTYDIEDQRSQFIKAVVSFLIMMACYFQKFISDKLLRMVQWVFYIIPIVLLFLGLSGRFNIFEEMHSNYQNQYVSDKVDEYGHYADMVDDTRTFIYEEVINSAINNDYVLFGRTPARGNDTHFFSEFSDELKFVRNEVNIKTERNSNEVCFLNIFTWLGLVGMLLYIGIYLMASYQAIYKSNNKYVKLIGIYVAFNFMYGWVENATSFDILNITYWLMISICLSPQFRSMSDDQFKVWFNKIFA